MYDDVEVVDVDDGWEVHTSLPKSVHRRTRMTLLNKLLDSWFNNIDIGPTHKSRIIQPRKHLTITFGVNRDRVVEMEMTPTLTVIITADGDVMRFGAMDEELINMFEVSSVIFKGEHL